MQLHTTIQAGEFGGRQLVLPPESITRAVSSKVRGAIFNTLGDLVGLQVLDLFAGGGTLGLEALSHGAARTTSVDANDKAVKAIKANIAKLGVKAKADVQLKKVEQFIASDKGQYDIVFFDPPYAEFNIDLVEGLAHLVQLGGILVLSSSSRARFKTPPQFEMVKVKDYGDTKITYLRKK